MAERPDTRTEIDRNSALRESQERFISVWGQMGAKWGIPRTMAEVHALLFIVGEPMNTDEVMERLKISRGNASTTLRALEEWGIVDRLHQPGDRKEYFKAEQDVWRLFRTVVRERKKREIDPLLEALDACRSMTDHPPAALGVDRKTLKAHNARIDDLLSVMRLIESISQRFVSPAGKGLHVAARILSRAS